MVKSKIFQKIARKGFWSKNLKYDFVSETNAVALKFRNLITNLLTCLSDVESQIEIMADILINDKSRSVNIFYRQLRVGKIHTFRYVIFIQNSRRWDVAGNE